MCGAGKGILGRLRPEHVQLDAGSPAVTDSSPNGAGLRHSDGSLEDFSPTYQQGGGVHRADGLD